MADRDPGKNAAVSVKERFLAWRDDMRMKIGGRPWAFAGRILVAASAALLRFWFRCLLTAGIVAIAILYIVSPEYAVEAGELRSLAMLSGFAIQLAVTGIRAAHRLATRTRQET